jgi:ribosome recycling factor
MKNVSNKINYSNLDLEPQTATLNIQIQIAKTTYTRKKRKFRIPCQSGIPQGKNVDSVTWTMKKNADTEKEMDEL